MGVRRTGTWLGDGEGERGGEGERDGDSERDGVEAGDRARWGERVEMLIEDDGRGGVRLSDRVGSDRAGGDDGAGQSSAGSGLFGVARRGTAMATATATGEPGVPCIVWRGACWREGSAAGVALAVDVSSPVHLSPSISGELRDVVV